MATVRGGITVKPHVQAFADACQAATGAGVYGTYVGHSPPEGPTQALDIFNPDSPAGYALQDRIVEFARANLRRFGVRYCIRREHIWNVERAAEGWRRQKHYGNRTADHYDHVHITFYATGAAVPQPQPQPKPEDDMAGLFIFDGPPERNGGVYYTDGRVKWGVPNEAALVFYRTGKVPHLGKLPVAVFDALPWDDRDKPAAPRAMGSLGGDGGEEVFDPRQTMEGTLYEALAREAEETDGQGRDDL